MLTVSSTDRVFILTGAGVSAESGIPTFRSAGGLWWNLPNGGGRLVARLATRSPVGEGSSTPCVGALLRQPTRIQPTSPSQN